jgi:ketosteroid isomerase-like protein
MMEEAVTEPARTIRTRADLEDYVAAFNRKDYARQISYYHPEVEYMVGTIVLSGPDAIAAFYADFHEYSDENVLIHDFTRTGWNSRQVRSATSSPSASTR